MLDTNASLQKEHVTSSDVCVLAESYLNPTVCGHSIPFYEWKFVAATTHRCPICHQAVSYIADGVAASMLASFGDTNAKAAQNAANLVYFKYGKLVCHLSVPNPGNDTAATGNGWSDLWRNFFSWGLRGEVASTTAQQRISFALGISLPYLKILHKGKVLYPVVPPFTERSLSDYLIELSSTKDRKCSPTLLVVGTPSSQQNELLSYEKQQQNPPKDMWTTVRTMQASDVISCVQWMIGMSVRFSLQLFKCARDSLHHGWKMLRNSSAPNSRAHPRSD